jgi:hypothetical protein
VRPPFLQAMQESSRRSQEPNHISEAETETEVDDDRVVTRRTRAVAQRPASHAASAPSALAFLPSRGWWVVRPPFLQAVQEPTVGRAVRDYGYQRGPSSNSQCDMHMPSQHMHSLWSSPFGSLAGFSHPLLARHCAAPVLCFPSFASHFLASAASFCADSHSSASASTHLLCHRRCPRLASFGMQQY